MAALTAVGRESSYPQITPTNRSLQFKVPPIGNILLIAVYLGFVLALEFINDNVTGAQHLQSLGVRAAWLAIAQVPLLILLVGKNNLIGLFTGISYERLNVLHRWVARVLLLLATFHFGFQARGWSEFPGIFELEWTTDSCVPTGLATYVILIWMNISTFAPIRNFCYEFFVIQHIVTFFGFIIAIMIHLPSTALYSRVYIYIPIGFYLFDRLVRFLIYTYNNLRVSRASLTALDGEATKIVLRNPRIKTWRAGAHVLISFPALGFGQNHPATIASTPESHDGQIVLILKSQKGFTRRMLTHANESTTSLLTQGSGKPQGSDSMTRTYAALVDGPYGGQHADFAAFDSVCLVAGSTGITFILPILLNLAYRAEMTAGKLPVRRVHLVWCIKEFIHAKWILSELSSAFLRLRRAGIESEVSFYVTCADSFTTSGGYKECGCQCDKSLGPCCCINPEDIEAERAILGPLTGEINVNSNISTSCCNEKGKAPLVETDALNDESSPSPARTKAAAYSGRPDTKEIIATLMDQANGETGVAVCGPLGMSVDVRNAVASLSDERACYKGSGAEGVYLHVEGFSQ